MSGPGDYLAFAALAALLSIAAVAFLRRRRPRAGLSALVAGNALVLAAGLAWILFGFETWLRFGYDASDGDNRTMISRRWFARHWRNNNLGFRDNVDYALRRDPARRRITFLGDSFTAGHGVADVEERFANRLRRARPEWEVHALAFPGLETPEEQRLLQRMLARGYELDVVVLAYYVENVGRFVPELREYFARAADPLPQPLAFLIRHSFAIDTIAYRAQSRRMYASGYWSDVYRVAYAGPAWQEQQQAFRHLRALVLDHGGRFAALTFPPLAGVEDRRSMVDRVAAFWQSEGVPHLDVLDVFEPHASRDLVANPHDAHPSGFAHRLAAEAIDRFLTERVLTE